MKIDFDNENILRSKLLKQCAAALIDIVQTKYKNLACVKISLDTCADNNFVVRVTFFSNELTNAAIDIYYFYRTEKIKKVFDLCKKLLANNETSLAQVEEVVKREDL